MCRKSTEVSWRDKVCTETRSKVRIKCLIWCCYRIYFRYRSESHFLKIKHVQRLRMLSKKTLLHYQVRMLLMISHLLVLLNFFSHFLLYGHSCQWSVGTVKHVQSPSAFTTSPAGSKMPLLIFQNLWALKMVHFQSIPCKHLTLSQHFLQLLQAAWATISKHQNAD